MDHPGCVLVQWLTLQQDVVPRLLSTDFRLNKLENFVIFGLEEVGVACLADLALELLPVVARHLVSDGRPLAALRRQPILQA